jgi:hypothetical protein
MANLRVNKITSTETFEKTGSVQFDGSGDVLTVPNSADFRLGNDDFTIEFWFVYDGTIASTRTLFSLFENASVDRRSYQTEVRSDGVIRFEYTTDGSSGISFDSEAGTISAGTWYHYAVTRTNGIITQYLNGASVSIGFVSTNSFFNNTDDPFRIGALNAAVNQPFTGHITNFRVVKGKALYTANFKPPMRELEVTPETTLLCCQSKTDASLEKTGKTITVTGNAVASELTPGILTPVPKAGAGSAITGSVEFDGTGDYLSLSSSSDFAFGTGDFTVEGFINRSTLAETDNVIDCRNGSSGGWKVQIETDGDISFFSEITNGFPIGSDMFRTIAHEWYHFAFTRSGGTLFGFINGVLIGSASHDSNYSTSIPCIIGARFSEDQQYHKGFISNLRIVKGTALYTDDFIPPTRELKKVPGTVLLCCQDPNDPTTEATGKTITGYGNLDADTSSENLITNGNFTTSASDGWTVVEGTGTTVLGSAQSGTFLDGPHLVLTATSGSFVFLGQQFTTKIGSTYLVNVQSNGADESFISTDSDKDNAIITDIRNTGGNNKVGNQMFVATQTSYHMILRGGTGGGNFDTASVYKVLTPNGASDFTPQVGDDKSVILDGVTNMNTENYFYLPTGDTVTRDSRSGRGLFGGGNTPTATATIDFVQIQTQGNAQDFGDLTSARQASGLGSATRGVFGGTGHPNGNIMDFVTFATTSNAVDFGDLQSSLNGKASAANSTRGIFAGGGTPSVSNEIDFITIATTGDATNFGDLTAARRNHAGVASPIRAVFAGGDAGPTTDAIDFVTIASIGNAVDFGDLSAARETAGGASSSTRGVFMGGYTSPGDVDVIEYITIASKGDAKDFGNLSAARRNGCGVSNNIRGLYAGGHPSVNTIEFVTIASTGDANDFGDLLTGRLIGTNGASDSHGGLG